MSLPLPTLDDRDWNQLVEEARRRIQQTCPDWTDLSPHDPGIVLLELFAHLTETMIYRLNRVPEKAYIEFLRLLGVRIHPPAAASVMLRFARSRATDQPLEIPRGTRVTVGRSSSGQEAAVFVTARAVTIPAGETQVEVLAHHCELVQAELVGTANGQPGLTVRVQRPPIVAPTGDELDLLVGVEARPGEVDEQAPVIEYQEKVYRLWREVDDFASLGPDPHAYLVDRMAGAITFAPAARIVQADGTLALGSGALGAIPQAGREIRVWYRRGGGSAGNVAANALTVLKDPIPGLEVTNPSPATGGQPEESLQNALVRGPQELHSLHRAVTAQDFELLAMSSSRSVARAKALTRAALWTYATPGTVEVLLVPYLPEEARGAGQVTAAALRERESEPVRTQIQDALDERRPLGTTCIVNWARYKSARVKARIVVRRQENQAALRQQVVERLHQSINPLPTALNPIGWAFGRALRASNVFEIALAEPGVLWVDQVRLLVEEVPNKGVSFIAADAWQPHTWYAGAAGVLFRSLNDGEGWEAIGHFPDEQITVVRAHPDRAGLLAVATTLAAGGASRVRISRDCGESWDPATQSTSFVVHGLAWTLRENTPVLLMATDAGLYELGLQPDAVPLQVLVDSQNQSMSLYAVTAARDVRGQVSVAVAAQATGGVFLSSEGGRSGSFRRIGLQGEDIRVLGVQYDGPRSYLWAGAAAEGGDVGHGCFRWELRGSEDPPEGWRNFGQGWQGGSCRALAFRGSRVSAATHHAGVLSVDAAQREAKWAVPDVRCGLPLRDPGRFHPVDAVASDPGGNLLLAGGVEGVYSSADGGQTFQPASAAEFLENVPLPPTWLFCSGEHEITVVSEDEAK